MEAHWPGRDLLDNGDRLADGDKAGKKLFLDKDFILMTLFLDPSFSSADPVDTTTMPSAVASVRVMMVKPVR